MRVYILYRWEKSENWAGQEDDGAPYRVVAGVYSTQGLAGKAASIHPKFISHDWEIVDYDLDMEAS